MGNGDLKRGKGLMGKAELPTPNYQLPLRGSPVAHGGNHARCSTWGDPKTALAPQDRAGSPITNSQLPIPNSQFPIPNSQFPIPNPSTPKTFYQNN
ncbi:hypothetical protein NIES4075_47760 [Tolypothrix sp. NIES-4075]|uniref:hypothetical protein n=1 Tax=Tolypothrix sp. NIES-4075 TaxID=2005459 RepID=UPI000B6448EF|nr:hypothetical protein [Tolypothrix sp. NIES-4075]GAX43761.1 hypothetical protein NIES4075_47760 [Tolypothrix sp. NIES-4075]